MFDVLAGADPYDRHSVDVIRSSTVAEPDACALTCRGRSARSTTTSGRVFARVLGAGRERRRLARACRTARRRGRRSPPPRRAGPTRRRSSSPSCSARTRARSWRRATRSPPTSTSARRSQREQIHRAYAQLFERSGPAAHADRRLRGLRRHAGGAADGPRLGRLPLRRQPRGPAGLRDPDGPRRRRPAHLPTDHRSARRRRRCARGRTAHRGAAPCCAVRLTFAATSGPTGRRSTSSRRPRSTCSASTAGCAASRSSTTSTASRARTRRSSSRRSARTASSRRSRTSTTTCCRTRRCSTTSRGGLALFVFFDEQTEKLCEEIGLKIALPSAELRHRLDSKIVTTQLGNEAGVPRVPNRLGRARSYDELLELADGLGDDLVVQTPVRRLRQDDVLHQGRARLGRARRGHRRRGAEGHEAHQLPRGGGRGRDHPPRHRRRPGHARPHRPPGADALPRRLVRQRHLRRTRSTPSSATAPACSPSSSATAWRSRATAASSRSTTCSTSTPASSTSASSTRA